jgi:hypothetical protein
LNRYRAYWPLDDAPLRDGDGGFVGVDERLEPDQLAPGMVASATNARFRHGRIESRPGITILPWMKADGRTPFTTSNVMTVWKVSPPAAYVDKVGGVNVFVPDGTNDAVVGVRFSEVQNIYYAEVQLDGSGTNYWSSRTNTKPVVGIMTNGVVQNSAYTSTLGLSTQEAQLVFSLGSFSLSGALASHYLTITVNCETIGTLTGYLTFGP